MAVGNQATPQTLNAALGQVALNLRAVMERVNDLAKYATAAGTAGLEAAGLDASDAAAYLQATGYLSTLAGVYYGTVQQGGSGGTGAADFNFDAALSVLWGAQ